MREITFCTIALKKFNVMSLIYPIVFSLLGALVIGVPLGLIAGIIDTVFLRSGTIVEVFLWIFGIIWAVIIIFCFISFFKTIGAIADTVDSLCIGDGKENMNIWLVLLIDIATIGIYKFIYFYQLQERLENRTHEYNEGVITSSSSLLLFTVLASLVGIGFIVGAALMIEDVNQLVYISNEQNNYETNEYQSLGVSDIIKKLRYRY